MDFFPSYYLKAFETSYLLSSYTIIFV